MTETQLILIIAAIFYRTSPVQGCGQDENKIDEAWAVRAALDFIAKANR